MGKGLIQFISVYFIEGHILRILTEFTRLSRDTSEICIQVKKNVLRIRTWSAWFQNLSDDPVSFVLVHPQDGMKVEMMLEISHSLYDRGTDQSDGYQPHKTIVPSWYVLVNVIPTGRKGREMHSWWNRCQISSKRIQTTILYENHLFFHCTTCCFTALRLPGRR